MHNFENYQRNANQKYSKLSLPTVRNDYHFKSGQVACAREGVKERESPALLVEIQCGAAATGTAQRLNRHRHHGKQHKLESPCDPATPLPSTCMEESNSKRYMSLTVHRSTVNRSQDTEDTCPLRDEQIKTWCMYMMKYCSAIKIEGNNATCINTDKFRVYHTK